jgi:hypothetical protein
LKNLQASNFAEFRKVFTAKLLKMFLIPSDMFDNVKGKFPIGFFIYDCGQSEVFKGVNADVYDKNGNFLLKKSIFNFDEGKGKLNTFISEFSRNGNGHYFSIGNFHSNSNDFQHQNDVFIDNEQGKKTFGGLHCEISQKNLMICAIGFAVRHCIEATWLNDRDQFLYPNEGWKTDTEFQNDCLAFTLFHGQNKISAKYGTNHWIPFTEQEINASAKFESNFMTNFIQGKLKPNGNGNLYEPEKVRTTPLEFSSEATAVFDAGRELWKYYHKVIKELPEWADKPNVNASLYDIKEYFQGRNEKGKMNNKSADETYNQLIAELRNSLQKLGEKIEPRVYQYGFLKR